MHPVHVSVTNLEFQSESNTISLSFKVFTDDFQMLINQLYDIQVDFSENGNYDLHKEQIDDYFQNHFNIIVKGKGLNYISDGIKRNDEAVWFFYTIALKKEVKTFTLKNSILLDLYPDQKNLLIWKKGKIEKGYQFTIRKKEYTIKTDEY